MNNFEPVRPLIDIQAIQDRLFKGKRQRIAEMIIQGESEEAIAKAVSLSTAMVKKHICFLKSQTGTQTLHGLSAYLSLYWYHLKIQGNHSEDIRLHR
jgi:DNA-binding NarL/FixJ family response regulator